MKRPFAPPARLSPNLTRVRDYWSSLLRGGATMPFWDDVKLSDLPDLSDRLLLIDVFEQPERFRLNAIGAGLGGEALAGLFIDQTELGHPFAYLRAQCAATVEASAPTYHRCETPDPAYGRLLLPMWGQGRIGMLLGAVDFD
jgi:hypothetical protein